MTRKILLTLALTALTSLPSFAGDTYYGKLTAKSTETAKGLVYASTSNSTPSDSDYTNSISVTSNGTGNNDVDLTFYAYAKAARGYAFSSWTAGTNTTVGANTGSADAITVSSSGTESSPTTGTVTANWTARTDGYTISYQAPTNGTYTVTYSYTAVESSKFTTATTEYSLNPVSDTQAVTSYDDDEVTLSTTRDDFTGWYTVSGETETELSTEKTYTFTPSADATITAKFSGTTSDNVASVTSKGTTTNYSSLADAITAANALTTTPTVKLLSDIYGIDAMLTLSKSMIIDLNGHLVTATTSSTSYNKMFYINTSGIEVTITDSSTGGDGQMMFAGELNTSLYGIYLNKGTLNITGGKIYAQNKASYLSYTSSRTYGVLVATGNTLNVSGGEIEADGSRNVYGICANGSASASSTVNITGGTITSNASYSAGYAYGVLSYSDVKVSGGTINANSTAGTYAYGIYVNASTSTVETNCYHGELTMEGGTISATATQNAFGVYVFAATNGTTGVKSEGEANISGGSISATTTSTTNAFGVYIYATSRSITSGDYAGYYAAAGSATISGGDISATAATTTAYGVYALRSMQMNGQEIAAIGRGKLTITDGTITATTGTTTACGVNTYGPTEISGGTITANASTTTAYGVRIYDDTTTIKGGTISATATQNAYGVYVTAETNSKTGVKTEGVASISGGSISATTTSTTGAYGLYIYATSRSITSNDDGYYPGYYAAAGAATISGGSISATAATTTAYSVYAAATSTNGTASATPTCAITGGDFAVSATSAYANINSTAVTDSVTISDGYYTDVANLNRYLLDGLYVYELESTHTKYTDGYRYYISAYQDDVYVALNKNTSTYFTTLETALDEASSGNVVVLINPYKLSGTTTVKSGVTLLIPYDSDYTVEDDEPETTETFNINGGAYKTLTMLSGSAITVESSGAICVGGVVFGSTNSDNGSNGGIGSVSGNYGCIDMSQGGTITLKSGSNLYAWGYIVGQGMSEGDNTTAGSIVAESGSNVYENFYVGDWHGGGNAYALYSYRTSYKVFPFNQYTTPNIEVSLTLEYGATENVYLFVPTSSMDIQESFPFIGNSSSGSLFQMSDGCSVTKRYDPTTDRLHIDVEGDLTVGAISFSATLFSISSEDFVLPITNNLYIRAKSGTLTVPYEMSILPHAVVEICEGAKATISSNVYVYDLDEWDAYVYNASYYYRTYNYRPTEHLRRTTTDWANKNLLEDAKLIVDGTMTVSGDLYTTSSGGDICSTDAGTITFTAAPTASSNIYQVLGLGKTETDYEASGTIPLSGTYTQYCTQIPVVASKLHNVDDSYTATTGSSAGTTFNYVNGYWITGSETVTAYTPGNTTGESKSFAEWKELQEGNYPNAVALYAGSDTTALKIANKLPNIVVGTSSDDDGATCANFVATDKQPINIPFEFTATTASYSRAATSYSGELQLGTICLPFDVTSDEDITYYKLVSVDDNQMTFTEVNELAANTPALFSVATDADRTTVDIVAENATIPVTTEGTSTAGGLTLNGVMKAAKTLTASSESTDYYIAQNMFWQPTTNNVIVNPFRAYFTSNGTANAARYSIAIGYSDETTSVSSVFNSSDDEIEGVYGVNGIRRDTVQKGINIIRFKSGRTQKVLIK